MSLDINQSYNDANQKIKSINTYKDSRDEIKDRLNQAGSNVKDKSNDIKNKVQDGKNKVQEGINNIQSGLNNLQAGIGNLQATASDALSYARNESINQLDRLINTYTNSQQPGSATLSYLLGKFIRSFKILKPQLKDIFINCILEKLNCDYESEYIIDEDVAYYIKINNFDFQQLLKIEPSSRSGKILYERVPFTNAQINLSPKSTNNLFWNLIQNLNVPMSEIYSASYKGTNNQYLFDLTYVKDYFNEEGGQVFGDFIKVNLKKPVNTEGQFIDKAKVYDFLKSYYGTIEVFDIRAFFNSILNLNFGALDIELGYGSKTLTDKTKFGLLVQRLLGQCYDEDTEISVGGFSKLPELDDTSDRFFELSFNQEIFIETKNALTLKKVAVFENCDSVELPVSDEQIEYMFALNESVTETNIENYLSNTLITTLSTDPSWSLTFPFPNRLKASFLGGLISEFPLLVTISVMGPKVVFPLFVMLKALGIPYPEDLINSRVEFLKKFRKFFECISSRIMSHFIKIIYEEIKKDLKNLAKALYIDITGDATASVYIVVESLVNVALVISSLIKDYRRCRSIIDGILSLLKLSRNVASNIPGPLLLLSNLKPGFSPTRVFIEHIGNLDKLGLPTGPGPDGSPNMDLMKDFSLISSFHREMIENGKMVGAFSLEGVPPTGGFPSYVKIQGNFL